MTTGAGVTHTGVGIIGAGEWDLVTASVLAGATLIMAGVAAGVILTTAVAGVGVITVTETFLEATVTVR